MIDGPLDLIVRGGRVLDPGQKLDATLDVGVRDGRIVALGPALGAASGQDDVHSPRIVDAAGAFVVPGLIDLHMHVYTGVSPITVPADESCMGSGVTTAVSAGDAGAHTIEGFRRLIIEQSRTRVLAFLHISTVGMTPFPVGEALDLDLLDVDAAVRAANRFPELVVGIKVRAGGQGVVGPNGLEAIRRAVQAGDRAGLPVMVHITDAAMPIGAMLSKLRAGDIVTHCFTGTASGLTQGEALAEGVVAARERGIRFDVGHGAGSFDLRAARVAAAHGFWPDTISTDLHSVSFPLVRDLPTTMTKLLALGMPVQEVIAAVTERPAKVIGRYPDLGSLRVGNIADIAVIDAVEGPVELRDSYGGTMTGSRRLAARATIRAGIPWGMPSHPGVGVAIASDAVRSRPVSEHHIG